MSRVCRQKYILIKFDSKNMLGNTKIMGGTFGGFAIGLRKFILICETCGIENGNPSAIQTMLICIALEVQRAIFKCLIFMISNGDMMSGEN